MQKLGLLSDPLGPIFPPTPLPSRRPAPSEVACQPAQMPPLRTLPPYPSDSNALLLASSPPSLWPLLSTPLLSLPSRGWSSGPAPFPFLHNLSLFSDSLVPPSVGSSEAHAQVSNCPRGPPSPGASVLPALVSSAPQVPPQTLASRESP